MINIKEKIEFKKANIISDLYEWAETYGWELDDDGERTLESYNVVFSLIERFEKGQCNESDYKNILFHIEQINYNEIKIKL